MTDGYGGSQGGLSADAQIMTLRGIRAIVDLDQGDRIITRSGARVLKDIVILEGTKFQLEFDRPEVVLLADCQVHSDTGAVFQVR